MRAEQTLAASAVEAVLTRNTDRLCATARRELAPFEGRGRPAQRRATKMPLDGERHPVRLGLRKIARPAVLVEGDVLAAPAAIDGAAARRRHAPGRHDPILGGQANPSIRSGTVA